MQLFWVFLGIMILQEDLSYDVAALGVSPFLEK